MTNAWCHDTARDAAVRAAEDNRTGPLPTLGEAIARPFADAAERSPTVSKTGEPQSGMRTERVTLEVTSAHDERLADCIVESIGDSLLHGESVRVVEEAHFDDLAQVAMERDAAIREREELRVKRDELQTGCNRLKAQLAKKDAPYKTALDAAIKGMERAQRERDDAINEYHSVSAERDAAIRERDRIRENAKADHNIAKAACDERDAAILAREDSVAFWKGELRSRTAERDGSRARVAELEADVNDCNIILGNRWRDAVSVVTGKAAPAASSGGEQSNQPLADGGRPRGERAESATADSSPSLSLDTPGAPADGADPTASGGGEGEPVAISPAERDGLQVIVDGVVRHGNGFVVVPGSDSLRAVESVLARHTTAPPQPRGWLTQEERALVQSWERHYTQGAHYAQSPSHTNDIAAEMGKLAEVCRAFLARSSPPEVVLESWREAAGEVVSLDDVRAALAAIGVVVKEVGRE